MPALQTCRYPEICAAPSLTGWVQFEECLAKELQQIQDAKESFLKSFSHEDFDALVNGWKVLSLPLQHGADCSMQSPIGFKCGCLLHCQAQPA